MGLRFRHSIPITGLVFIAAIAILAGCGKPKPYQPQYKAGTIERYVEDRLVAALGHTARGFLRPKGIQDRPNTEERRVDYVGIPGGGYLDIRVCLDKEFMNVDTLKAAVTTAHTVAKTLLFDQNLIAMRKAANQSPDPAKCIKLSISSPYRKKVNGSVSYHSGYLATVTLPCNRFLPTDLQTLTPPQIWDGLADSRLIETTEHWAVVQAQLKD